jgi:hypothetical protein
MNGLQRREDSTLHSMDKGIKTTLEFMDKTWKIIQRDKRMIVEKKNHALLLGVSNIGRRNPSKFSL